MKNIFGKCRMPIVVVTVLFGVALIKTLPSFNYSIWVIDEEQIVTRALGFLDFDLNPKWFGYHTLPMYILASFYFVIFHLYNALGIVSSKIEFVSLLFTNEKVFFLTARLLASFAYTLGCFVLAIMIKKEFGAVKWAIFFFLLAVLLPDAYLSFKQS